MATHTKAEKSIVQRRQALGLSRAQLARASGLSYATLMHIENGSRKRPLSAAEGRALEKVLGVEAPTTAKPAPTNGNGHQERRADAISLRGGKAIKLYGRWEFSPDGFRPRSTESRVLVDA